TLRLRIEGDAAAFTLDNHHRPDILYRIEESRGYESSGALWSPGHFRVNLKPGREVVLVASTEKWETISALTAPAALSAERERRRRLLQAAVPAAQTRFRANLDLAAD